MLLVFTQQSSPRLRYILKLFIEELMGIPFKLTHNREDFKSYSGAKLNYSESPIENEPFIFSEKLLFEKGIEDQQFGFTEWAGQKAFYATHPKYLIPFDVFAASFYLVSRYEEYLPHLRDSHDRYNETESLAYTRGFLQKPLINIWAKNLREVLLSYYPALSYTPSRYRYISTIDIDNAYAYLEKGFMRTAGAYGRSVINLDFQQIVERTKVLLRLAHDPYDTYDLMLDLHKRYKVNAIYFFLMGEYGENDKNVSVDSRTFQSLIQSLADYAETGIHPSYGSNSRPGRLQKEVQILSRILKREVKKSRQHFLKLKLPDTYRKLIDVDIKDDFTMGYAGNIGFRAGICSPFNFYDLDNETSTTLRVHPFAVMDATFRYYLKVEPYQVIDMIKPLVDEVKAVNGTFISLWHNESLSENHIWKGYRSVYEELLRIASA
ncbi:MAG: polysaccharide deacetylase family protein [Bacteroidetes bacterium]|jgi:hypothetical protein|nr:polysaccharide deacetylase family protein [Bacteroidota bacterium]